MAEASASWPLALATRVSSQLDGAHTAILMAPQEYLPFQFAQRAMTLAVGEDNFVEIRYNPTRIEKLAEHLDRGANVLLDVGDEPLTVLEDFWTKRRLRKKYRGLCLAVRTTDAPIADSHWNVDVSIDHRALVVTEVDLGVELMSEPLAISSNADAYDAYMKQRRDLHLTGGVPMLLMAHAKGDDLLAQVCDRWVERIAPTVRQRPIDVALTWAGRVSHPTATALGRALSSRPLSTDEHHKVVNASWITQPDRLAPGIPDALAAAFERYLTNRAPERAEQVKSTLANYVMVHDELSGLERIEVLIRLGAYRQLEELLATKAHLLVHLSAVDRQGLLPHLPRGAVKSWQRVDRVRALLAGESDPIEVSGLPSSHSEFARLISIDEDVDPQSVLGQVLSIAEAHWGQFYQYPPDRLRETLESLCNELGAVAEELLRDAKQPSKFCDDAAMLVGVLVVLIDISLQTGTSGVSRQMWRTADRLVIAMRDAARSYSAMLSGFVARSALVAATMGSSSNAREYLSKYRQLSPGGEPMQQNVARLARSYADLEEARFRDLNRSLVMDLEQPLAPMRALETALAVLLAQGHQAALYWANQTLQQASWTSSPQWMWWDLSALTICLNAESGRVSEAQELCAHTTLPIPLNHIIDAYIFYYQGNYADARDKASMALEELAAPTRWRLNAAGLKLACLASMNDLGTQSEIILDGEDWASAPSSVAMLPAASRQMIVKRLPANLRSLPGLADTEVKPVVTLTPRQKDVLLLLAEGGTLAEIAKQLSVSLETVRSTSKALYQRMGVHDRDAAVAAGRRLGMVS